MEWPEIKHIIIALILFALIAGFRDALIDGPQAILISLVYAFVILGVNIIGKKIAARALDADIEHELWSVKRYGFLPHWQFDKPIPASVIIPPIFSLFSLGLLKIPAFLTYEARALKQRASRRFGFYSFTEMTDWHNALIGATGVIFVLILAGIAYFPGLEQLSKLAAYYALVNMIPISKLDGMQILFGSRALYAGLAVITLIFFGYALII